MPTAAIRSAPDTKVLNVSLWLAQALLAAAFLMAGGMKLYSSDQFPFPLALTLFIGAAEVLGAIGLIAPSVLRIKPMLTPLAAACLAVVMVLATAFHLSRGEPFAATMVLWALALFVAWGRVRALPLTPRNGPNR